MIAVHGRAALPVVLIALMLIWAAGNVAVREIGAGWRIDLTADRLHTLAPETRALLADLAEPVAAELVYSRRIGAVAPALAVEAERVREFLDTLSARAGGRLPLTVTDPAPFSEAEDRALAAGLTPVPLTDGGEAVYFGLILTNAVDRQRVIPFFGADPSADLERRVVTLLADLAVPVKPVAGLIAGLPILGGPAPDGVGRPGARLRPFLIAGPLSEAVAVRPLPVSGDGVDLSGLDLLILAHGRDLPDPVWDAIGGWIEAGRPTLILVDPWSEAEALRSPPQERFAPRSSTLGPLTPVLGVRVDPDRTVIDRAAGMRVNAGTRARPDLLPYPAWMRQSGPALSPRARETRGLDTVTFGTPGAIAPLDGTPAVVAPLVTTTPDAAAVPTARVSSRPDPRGLMAGFAPDPAAPFPLAARITGSPAGTPLDVVLIADTDWIDDRFWADRAAVERGAPVRPTADNARFLVNIVEALAGARDLSGLRGRGRADRPFTRIDTLVAEAEATYRAREQALRDRLAAVERDLSAPGTDARATEALRADLLTVRADLRAVQRALIERVERVRTAVTLSVGLAMPAAIALAALGIGAVRARRRRPAAP